jgi:superfamily II DNA helicase RecQ
MQINPLSLTAMGVSPRNFFFKKQHIMQIQIFTIPIYDNGDMMEEMNKFLRAHKVLELKEHFQAMPQGGAWCFCIKYLATTPRNVSNKIPSSANQEKKDYKKELDEATFNKFSILRAGRKELSAKEALPPFALFLDTELVEIAKLEEMSLSNIGKIKGIGKQKIERFVPNLLAYYQKHTKDEAS